MYKYILFDLDGTLTNSAGGIIKSLEYAFDAMGFERPPLETLKKFIGPPLMDSFQNILRFDEELSRTMIKKYRERYAVKGMFENYPYEGMTDLLYEVGKSGKILAVATSKPEHFSRTITDYFGLTKYFASVTGSENESEDKAAVIIKACKRLNIQENELGSVLMIGDRKHDIIGAHKCGIKCCGVEYGFAPAGELKEYGADYVVKTVDDLKEFLLAN